MKFFKTIQTIKLIASFSVLLIFVTGSNAVSQLKDGSISSQNKELFYVDPLIFFNQEMLKPRLDVYLEVPLENLQFKRNYSNNRYDASLNYAIIIKNYANETVINETFTDYISTSRDEQKTLKEASKFIVKEYYLNPGRYSVNVSISDINTKREESKSAVINISDFTQQDVSFSDIMLVSNLEESNGKKRITPLVDRNVGDLKEFYLFLEVYNEKNENIINTFSYRIIDDKNKVLGHGSYVYNLYPGANKIIEKITTDNIISGAYKFELRDNSSDALIAVKDFYSKWTNIPINVKDLNLVVDQLIYIASSDELKKIKSARTRDDKEKRFVEFWRSKDPSPNTGRNELMEEYYNRIKVANERYSHWIDGWKTDMGMVYIIYGNPSNIQRFPFSENTKPYEVWDYYNMNKQFIFLDESGFGDYRLTTPIWDDTGNRLRY
jgi:GWxTD domain-containing protein